MTKVKSKNNKSTELKFILLLRANNIKGWRRSIKMIGNPDFAFPNKKLAIFIDGCFWHGHNCRNLKPRHNWSYWEDKIFKNRKRDMHVNKTLKKLGWNIIRIWECKLNKGKCIVHKIESYL
ncbi:MAG: very short patch repair endonuclease [Elusimicrobia bacterium RIFOXYB2_FULL_48_7]|nr:MAG: very short patch repair endonuclease [Elusimicrobia bacterium RIFOXYB2_FULL_48_7]